MDLEGIKTGLDEGGVASNVLLGKSSTPQLVQWVGPDGAAGTVYNGKDGQERASLSLSSPDFISQLRLKGPKGAGACDGSGDSRGQTEFGTLGVRPSSNLNWNSV